MLTRRAAILAGIAAPFAARAEAELPGMIRIILPFPAGGSSDAIMRMLQPGLQRRLGSTLILENKPGASATIGAAVVASAPPDGATWMLTSETFLVSPLLLGSVPFDVQKDFEPVTMIARGAMVLCAHPSRPYRSFTDLVSAAKTRPQTLAYATTGTGGNGHLTMAALSSLAGMQLVHVPYRGVGPALNDAVAGHVDMIISSTASLAPQIEAGQLRPLLQCGDKRASFLPDTPTAMESGFEGFQTYSWFGFFGPAGTPKPIVDRFFRDVVATVREEENYGQLINKFRVEVPLPTPDELRRIIAESLPFWAKVIRENNIKAPS